MKNLTTTQFISLLCSIIIQSGKSFHFHPTKTFTQGQRRTIPTCTDIQWKEDGATRVRLAMVEETEKDDDDGWGDADDTNDSNINTIMNAEIGKTRRSSGVQAQQEERDLFIPIFAIVSLLGLFGSYGYEMLRLASRGELYLPWNN